MSKYLLLIPLLFLLGCDTPGTPGTPQASDPPQVTVLKLTNLGATANNTAAHTLAALCSAPAKLDATTCSDTAVYLRLAAKTFDKVAAEAASTDSWPVMRVKIGQIGAGVATGAAIPDPTLRSQVDSVVAIVAQILEVR